VWTPLTDHGGSVCGVVWADSNYVVVCCWEGCLKKAISAHSMFEMTPSLSSVWLISNTAAVRGGCAGGGL